MKIKHTALLGALLAASLLLQSCGIIVLNTQEEETSAPAQTTTAESDAAVQTPSPVGAEKQYIRTDRTKEYQAYADAYLARIRDSGYSWEGESFFISSPRTDVIMPNDTDNTHSSAVYKRNQAVEDALNIRLAVSATDESAYFDLLNASILADDYFSDLLLIPQYQIGTFAAGDVLLNLRSAPLLDLNQPYFFADSLEAATGSNRIFAVAGSASFDETMLSAVYFNRDLFEGSGLELPYGLVYDGKWTWDAFLTSCAQTAVINENAKKNAQLTYSSYATQYVADQLPAMVFASCGGKMVRSPVNEAPFVSISQADSDALSVITRLYADSLAHTDTESGVSRFHTGKSLYLIDRLYLMSWMPNSAQNWGIVPMPKLTEQQENYITLTSAETLFFAMQKNTVDSSKASLVMSALNAASYGILSEAYTHYAMNHLLRDNDSANMLAIISASRSFDFALSFTGTTASLVEATTGGLKELANGLSAASLLKRASAADKKLASRFPAS